MISKFSTGMTTSAMSSSSASNAILRWNELETASEMGEEWDGTTPFYHHMLAGSCAGVAEHLCMYPVDTFKVRVVNAAVKGRLPRLALRAPGLTPLLAKK